MAVTLEDIKEKFTDVIGENDTLYQDCFDACKLYNLTADELYWKYEAQKFTSATIRRDSELADFTAHTLKTITDAIQAQNKKEAARKSRAQKHNVMNMSKQLPIPGHFNLKGAKIKAEPVDVTMGSVSASPFSSPPVAGPSRVDFRCPTTEKTSTTRSIRYMREKMTDRSRALEDQIQSFGELIVTHYNTTLSDPTLMGEEEIVTVGRITHDSDTTDDSSKLKEKNLTLEPSSVFAYSRSRIQIRFEASVKVRGGPKGASYVGMFPGAIVALRGMNRSGDWFSVSEVLTLPRPKSVPPLLPKLSQPFTVALAAGPFTPETDLGYAPFRQWLDTIKVDDPAVLLVVGPFVDGTNSLIKVGDVDYTPEEMFEKYLLEPLREYLDASKGCIAVLVPSTKDLISAHATIPQAPFPESLTKRDPRIKLVPNPARFTLNGAAFATTSLDVFHGLKSSEIRVPMPGGAIDVVETALPDEIDPFGGVCRYVLEQRSFYPVFPPPIGVNIDITRATTQGSLSLCEDQGDYEPDVLVVPSRFKQFSKTIHSTKAINPSSLNKGQHVLLRVDPKKQHREKVEVVFRDLKADA
ncbi:DNA polymerase alpha subunit B [Flagelloscypha sp. PMI_526]|nr:DNA polymerase alpha subunit B [Flagelloscypha sp. PMI_526]